MKTKIILAFPCMGKTYYAKHHSDIAIDLESSDYFFDKRGYEHLSSEVFKGLPNRVRNPNGLKDYLAAIDKAVKSGKYKYVFTSQSPDVVNGILKLGYEVQYVRPIPCQTSYDEFKRRAKERGNIPEWIENTIIYLNAMPWSYFNDALLERIHIDLVPPSWYLEDYLNNKG